MMDKKKLMMGALGLGAIYFVSVSSAKAEDDGISSTGSAPSLFTLGSQPNGITDGTKKESVSSGEVQPIFNIDMSSDFPVGETKKASNISSGGTSTNSTPQTGNQTISRGGWESVPSSWLSSKGKNIINSPYGEFSKTPTKKEEKTLDRGGWESVPSSWLSSYGKKTVGGYP